MNLKHLTSALFLLTTTACGAVVDPTDDPTAPNPEGAFDEPSVDGNLDREEPPMVTPPTLLVDAPRAATTTGSLFAMTFANNARIENVVVAEERTRIDVVEQKIVTLRDEEVHLEIELPTPTGTYSRVLVTDALTDRVAHAERPLCETNSIATYNPRCEFAVPASAEMPSAGAITTSTWKLTVVDDVSGAPLSSCIAVGASKLSCVLPSRASASYRIIASAYGFADLWNGAPGFGPFVMGQPHTMPSTPFVGAYATQPEYQCWDFPTSGSSVYCGAYYSFVRFTAIDRARLAFDPITLRITANGRTEATLATPALTWDAGNDDVPGAVY